MPPHLHPRSTYTSSLFATTLFASFFVVALPHVLPCPAPRVAYADANPNSNSNGQSSDGESKQPQRRRRKRRCVPEDEANGTPTTTTPSGEVDRDANGIMMRKRECPVPKPPGLIGEILGLRSERAERNSAGEESCSRGERNERR